MAEGSALPSNLEVAIPAGGGWDGLLVLSRPARIDGRMRGEVLARGQLWLGPEAEVDARIQARELVVEGSLSGEAHASERIELRSTAMVHAALETPKLALTKGAQLHGECRAGETETP